MFRCGNYLGSGSPLVRGIHLATRLTKHSSLTHVVRCGVDVVPTRCLSGCVRRREPVPGTGARTSQLLSHVPLGGNSHRGYQDKKAGRRGPNMMAIVGAGVTAILGTIFYMSSGSVMDDPTKPKSNGKKTAADKTEPSTDKSEPAKKLPEHVTYLIVGAGTAAMTASKTIRTNDPTAKVLMVTEESYRPYMRPPLSKELWFKGAQPEQLSFSDWAGKTKNVFYQPEEFFLSPELLNDAENGGIAVACQKKINQLDVGEQVAHFSDGTSIKYDKCLLATGGVPRNLPVFQKLDPAASDHVHLFRNIEDFHRLHKAVSGSKSVTVVGGGFLGSELAVALAQKGKENKLQVYQAFPEDGNMGLVFPEYLSQWTMEKVKQEGVDVRPNALVVGCEYNKRSKQLDLTLNNGEKLRTDQVVVAVGLQPNVDLARSSGLEVDDQHGGFLVNAELEARKNLWVAGDAACFYDVSLGRRRVEHHDHAVVSGRLAGDNMTGKAKPYWHQSMFWSDLGPAVGYEAIGICDSRLPTFAVFAKATEKDTPRAVVEQTGEGLRSETEDKEPPTAQAAAVTEATMAEVPHTPQNGEDYGKGVIFYTRDNRIVGMILWNLFGRMPVARQVLKEAKKSPDLTEIAKLFDVHDQNKADN